MRTARPTDKLLPSKTYRDTILSYRVEFFSRRMDDPAPSIIRQRLGNSHRLLQWTFLICICCLCSSLLSAQDWVKTGTSLGVQKVRLAAADFKPATTDPQNAALLKTFNDTLWNDLDVSGIVDLVSKSFYPLQVPGQPPEVNFLAWNGPPPNA